jgi:Fe-S-cluster containining protein
MWNGPVYDCQQCGACCADQDASPEGGYVYLDKEESKRMKRMGLSVVQDCGDSFLGTRAYPGGEAPLVCVAFRGAIGGRCGCSIYASRPQGCRRFEVGSPLCRRARRDAGLAV